SRPGQEPPPRGRVATPIEVAEAAPTPRERTAQRGDGRVSRSVPLVTGLHDGPEIRLADLAQHIDPDLEQEEAVLHRRRGGGMMTVIIVLLVVVTLGGLYVLRDWFIRRDHGRAPEADLAPAAPAVVPDLAPAAGPDKAPAVKGPEALGKVVEPPK